MKLKWGALVVDGRGKIGGHVASKNRGGAYLRTKVTPVNKQSAYQLAVRNRFTGLSQGWKGLTPAQIAAWNAAVAGYAKTDIFGDVHQPSGFSLYQRLNNNLETCGEAALTTPPLPEAVGIVVAGALTATAAGGLLSQVIGAAVPADTKVKVYATAPQSPGKSFVKSNYRLIQIVAAAAPSPLNLKAAYDLKFGSVGPAGQKIFVKLIAVNTNTGQEGTPSSSEAIVA